MAFLALAYGLALALWSLAGSRCIPVWLSHCVGVAVLFTPMLIPGQHVMPRAWACMLSVELFFKTSDYVSQRRQGSIEDKRFLRYAGFLVPFPVFLVRFGERHRGSQFTLSGCREAVVAGGIVLLCFILLGLMSGIASVRTSFLLDHSLKFVVFTLAIESLARLLHGLERMAGYNTRPLIDDAWRSRTVGEFWDRYNTRVHSWFEHNVFLPLNARRAPVRAVIVTFLLSAILHEIGFAIATSRIDGYQFTFFILKAPAVILWRSLQRYANGPATRIMLQVSTILWMWATSMFFFHGVNRVFPFFYAADPWLP